MPNIVVRDNGDVAVVVVDEPGVHLVEQTQTGVTVSDSGTVIVREIDVVGTKGDKGEQGPQGVPGEEGPPGASAINPIVFDQAVPAQTWTIEHGLNTYPLLTVVDSANQTVMGDIKYLDANTVQLTFSAPFSGTAYLI
jgi:hypothetical protein